MSTVDRIQQEVMGELLRGELPPGGWLRQDDVANRLGVSKIPVREALQRLAALGLLQFESNRGAHVPHLTVADAEENFALRRAIESPLLERAIGRLTPVDLAVAEQALDGADTAIAEANWRFHRALYRAAGWRRGLAMAEILHAAVAPYVVLYTAELGGGDESDIEHTGLLDACRRGDVAGAHELLHIHLSRAERTLVDYLASVDRSALSQRGVS